MINNLSSHLSVPRQRVTAPLIGLLLMLGAAPSSAEVIHQTPCLEDSFGGGLNCTANDVDVSMATNIQILDDGCLFPGDTVTFSMDFIMTLNATARYDIALYVASDGDPNDDGARTGTCNLFSPPITPDPPYVDLDHDTPTQSCGDIDSGHSPMDVENIVFIATCVDDDGNGKLDMPYGTSWSQSADEDNCKGPADAIPENRSKCFLNPGGFIDIEVPTVKLEIDKTGPTNVAPGDTFAYEINFTNADTGLGYDQDATNLVLVDDLEPELTYLSAAVSGGGTCSYSGTPDVTYGGTVTCTWPSGYLLPVGDGETVLLSVRANPNLPLTPETIPNEACITGEGAVQNPAVPITVCDDHTITTPVTISYFSTDGASFDWTTATEVGNAGFNLYVKSAGKRQKINEALIPSLVVDSTAPQDYHHAASGVEGNTFYIEDVGLFGQNRLHGPFKRGKSHGNRIDPEPIDWAAIDSENQSLNAQRAGARKAAAESRLNRIRAASKSGLNGVRTAAGPRLNRMTSAVKSGALKSPDEKSPTSGKTETTLVAAKPTGSAFAATDDAAVVDLRVREAGIYRVTYADISAVVGPALDGVPMASLALTNRGKPVQMFVSSGETFGPGEFCEFIGAGADTLYTDTNVLKLQVNADLVARVAVDSSEAPSGSVAPFYYMERAAVENNNAYSPLGVNGDPWYDTRLLTYGSTTWTFPVTVDSLVSSASEEAVLEMQMWGVTDQVDEDHSILVELNGEALSEERFDAQEVVDFSQSLPQGVLFDGENTLALTATKPDEVSFDMSILESYAVTYPRAFVARDGALVFEGESELFNIEGLNGEVVAYRHREHGTTTRVSASVEGAASVTVRGGSAKGTYYVATEAALLKPEIVLTRQAADITSGEADMLIISHANFIDGLAPLVAAREAQGISVKLVDVEDVYTRYSDSIIDAGAIRTYLKYAIEEMGVKYVLLVGGDTRDYRQYIGDSISFIPSLYAQTNEYFHFSPVDPLYVDVDGDNLQDAAIGRFPVRTQAELEMMVAKTLQYGEREAGKKPPVLITDTAEFSADTPAASATVKKGVKTLQKRVSKVSKSRKSASLVAASGSSDKPDGSLVNSLQQGETKSGQAAVLAADAGFAYDAEGLAAKLPSSWITQKVYVEIDGADTARAELLEALNAGPKLASFVGHSGPNSWTFDGLLSSSDVANMSNEEPIVVTQWGCWNTYYVDPRYATMAHKYLLSSDVSGAAAVMGATTVTSAGHERKLGDLLMSRLVTPDTTVGAAMVEAKQELGTTDPGMLDVLLGWTLLGDPTLMIQPPLVKP